MTSSHHQNGESGQHKSDKHFYYSSLLIIFTIAPSFWYFYDERLFMTKEYRWLLEVGFQGIGRLLDYQTCADLYSVEDNYYLSATTVTVTWLSSTIANPFFLSEFQSKRSVQSVTLSALFVNGFFPLISSARFT